MSIYDRIVIAAIRLVQKVHEDRTGTILLPFESIMGVIIIVIPTDDRIADVQWFIIQPASKIFIDLLQFIILDVNRYRNQTFFLCFLCLCAFFLYRRFLFDRGIAFQLLILIDALLVLS